MRGSCLRATDQKWEGADHLSSWALPIRRPFRHRQLVRPGPAALGNLRGLRSLSGRSNPTLSARFSPKGLAGSNSMHWRYLKIWRRLWRVPLSARTTQTPAGLRRNPWVPAALRSNRMSGIGARRFAGDVQARHLRGRLQTPERACLHRPTKVPAALRVSRGVHSGLLLLRRAFFGLPVTRALSTRRQF